jgi:energy-coupling factor transporter ATP-binding protein EcfA2
VTPIAPDLSIQNLSFSYPEYPGIPARHLFNGLNLELPAGSIAVLLARPDEGKTTLCRLLAGLIPRFSGGRLRGEICLGTRQLPRQEPYDLIEQVGLVFQHPGEQLLASRCDSEVAFPLESLGIDRSEIEARLTGALRTMDLERYRCQSPKLLSGGEKKKLLIACLLAVDPRLWLLDETLEELDSTTKRQLLQLLKARRRSTLILSAKWHDLFREYVDRIFLMEEGRTRRVREAPGSPEFQRLLLKRGFVLPGEGRDSDNGSVRERASVAAGRTANRSTATDRKTLLAAEDLYFRYEEDGRGTEPAFTLQIDHLELAAGRVLAIVGDNGSGKSTLGRLLCGLLSPGRGEIRIRKGDELRPASAEDLNRFTGYLFQDPDLQIFLPTVFEELALGLKHLNLPAVEIERRVQETVSLFGLPAGEAPPSLMSYGIRKKLQAGVYHLLERPLMIIDEGDSGLSVNDFAEMVRIFRKQEGALIFITHDHRLADALADEVVELKSGSFA